MYHLVLRGIQDSRGGIILCKPSLKHTTIVKDDVKIFVLLNTPTSDKLTLCGFQIQLGNYMGIIRHSPPRHKTVCSILVKRISQEQTHTETNPIYNNSSIDIFRCTRQNYTSTSKRIANNLRSHPHWGKTKTPVPGNKTRYTAPTFRLSHINQIPANLRPNGLNIFQSSYFFFVFFSLLLFSIV